MASRRNGYLTTKNGMAIYNERAEEAKRREELQKMDTKTKYYNIYGASEEEKKGAKLPERFEELEKEFLSRWKQWEIVLFLLERMKR